VLVIRLEELAPFPAHQVREELRSKASPSAGVYYFQEEHMNEGAFQFAKLHLDLMIRELKFTTETAYIGRASQHSFATGAGTEHKAEVKKLWEDFDRHILN
jgi:2-oxoglutarate dehydrogenase complex dehydrogenase (E1) component-like enzyme